MLKTLQSRLLVGTAIGSVVVLLLSGGLLNGLIRRSMQADFDDALRGEAATLATLIESENGLVQSSMAEHGFPQFVREDRPDYYQIWSDDGKFVERSTQLKDRDLIKIVGSLEQPGFQTTTLPDGRPGRVVGVRFSPRVDEPDPDEPDAVREKINSVAKESIPVSLVVARDTVDLNRTLANLGFFLLVVFAGMIALILATLATLTRWALRPMGDAAGQIADIRIGDLTRRIRVLAAPKEVQTVVDGVNGLLDRVHMAFERERAFSANVAHELRTPLAGLRSMMEVSLLSPREATDYRRTIEQCLETNGQTESIVSNLLSLARLENGHCPFSGERVVVDELLDEMKAPTHQLAATRGVQIHWNLSNHLVIFTDPRKLRSILENLLENAVEHCHGAGPVEISANRKSGDVAIRIANPSKHLSDDQLSRVFDRFWRGDSARCQTGQHSGLGLAICQELAKALGASLKATQPSPSLFVIELQFPRSESVLPPTEKSG